MKKFIIIYEQSGGCDYTIGCGINYDFVYGDSLKKVKENILEEVKDRHFYDSEYRNMIINNDIDSFSIYEVSDEASLDLLKIRKEEESYLEKERKKAELKKKTVELENLKRELEGIYCDNCKKHFYPDTSLDICKECIEEKKKDTEKIVEAFEKRAKEIAKKRSKLQRLLLSHDFKSHPSSPNYCYTKDGVLINLDGGISFYIKKPKERKGKFKEVSLNDVKDKLDKEIFDFLKDIKGV